MSRSMAKLLRDRLGGKEERLSQIIDRFVVKRDMYDIDTVKAELKSLHDYIDSEDYNRDEFQLRFFTLYNAVYADLPRGHGKFHYSSLENECSRMLYYEMAGYEYTDGTKKPPSGRLQKIFDVGTWWHVYVQATLWRAGILEASEVRVRDRKKRINSRGDGIIRYPKGKRSLLEIKTMNSYSYAQGRLKVVDKHDYQASNYAKKLGLDSIVYLYINKDTSEMIDHVRGVSQHHVDHADEKIESILTAVEEGSAPKRVCTDKTDGKECPFVTLCFKTRK